MPTYAADTNVSADRSRSELERILTRYGADQFSYGWDRAAGIAMVQFVAHERQIRFVLTLPDPSDPEFTTTSTGRPRSASAAESAYDQAVRSRWRSLVLVVKAKLEAVNASISTFEREFLANIVLPDGSSVGDRVVPEIERAYTLGRTPRLLLEPPEES